MHLTFTRTRKRISRTPDLCQLKVFLQDLSGVGIGGQGPAGVLQLPQIVGNPACGSIVISLHENSSAFESDFRIYDLAGRIVLSRRLIVQPGSETRLDCSALPAGVYMISFGEGIPPDRFVLLK